MIIFNLIFYFTFHGLGCSSLEFCHSSEYVDFLLKQDSLGNPLKFEDLNKIALLSSEDFKELKEKVSKTTKSKIEYLGLDTIEFSPCEDSIKLDINESSLYKLLINGDKQLANFFNQSYSIEDYCNNVNGVIVFNKNKFYISFLNSSNSTVELLLEKKGDLLLSEIIIVHID